VDGELQHDFESKAWRPEGQVPEVAIGAQSAAKGYDELGSVCTSLTKPFEKSGDPVAVTQKAMLSASPAPNCGQIPCHPAPSAACIKNCGFEIGVVVCTSNSQADPVGSEQNPSIVAFGFICPDTTVHAPVSE
jgi:hypothetical protein